MKKTTILALIGVIIIAIIPGILLFPQDEQDERSTVLPKELIDENISPAISSGPLTILNSKHRLGENVFMHIEGLKPNEKGFIHFFTPKGKLHHSIPFDGSIKSDFNQYFKPDTNKVRGICGPEDLVGTWKVVFEGVSYQPLQFDILNEFIRGAEADIIKVC